MNKKAVIVIIVLLLIGAVFAYLLTANSPAMGSVQLRFSLPQNSDLKDVRVSFNSQAHTPTNQISTYSLSPGKYQLKITKPYFTTVSDTINVTSGEQTIVLPKLVPAAPPVPITANRLYLSGITQKPLKVLNNHFFFNGTWSVTTIGFNGDQAVVVLDYVPQTQAWAVVAGPGTGFINNSYLPNVPPQIQNYLTQGSS